jgi:hypothetical protein
MRVSFVICEPLSGLKKIGSWIIRTLDQSKASHFAVELDSLAGIYYYESVMPKSRCLPKDEWDKHYRIVQKWTFEVPKGLEYDVLLFLNDLINKPYSIAQLLLIAGGIFSGAFQIAFNKAIINHEKALICTEVGSRFIERFMRWNFVKSHDNMGIRDLTEICNALGISSNPWKEVA